MMKQGIIFRIKCDHPDCTESLSFESSVEALTLPLTGWTDLCPKHKGPTAEMAMDVPLRAVAKVRETVLAQYLGLSPICDATAATVIDKSRHLLWMCDQIEGMLASASDREKGVRWIGFMQGTLWALGLRSIDEMRQDNVRITGA